MAEESLETLFGSCVLDLLAPDTSISFPEDVIADDWLTSVKRPIVERKQAFFDEQLNLFLVIYIKHPYANDPHNGHSPPRSLVDLLSHIQVSLEATYISSTPNQSVSDTFTPRTSSLPKGRPLSLHPSIFPPNTPNPIPSTIESDRKYVQSEGTLLFSSIWGTKQPTAESKEKFTLLFSEKQGSWIAVYELSLVVSYLRLSFSDPLLCLTASATLREKALSPSQSTHPFILYLTGAGMISHLDPGVAASGEAEEEEEEEGEDTGLEEINLLDGLTLGSSISSDSDPLHLPSTRLGNTTRQRFFALPPVSVLARAPPSTSKQTPSHVLRKSFRKILQTVSGFRVRMRTVFVPHVLLPKNTSLSASDQGHGHEDFENGNEEREAGNNERTVVLCVEVENSGESGPTTGFSLERLDVKIGGEGATTRLIGWDEDAFGSDVEKRHFPLLIGSMEQYNLLYVVFFWNTPNDQEDILLSSRSGNGNELQRAVTITVYGRPYLLSEAEAKENILSYPTPTFSSRWNCILDLSSRPREEPVNFHETSVGCSALPEPPSPFPGRTATSSLITPTVPTTPIPQAIAGKRHTLPGSITAMRAINPTTNLRLSLPSREFPVGSTPIATPKASFTPPSVAFQAFNRSAATTFGATPPPPSGGIGFNASSSEIIPVQPFAPLPTPAYPAFSPSLTLNTNTPQAQALGSQLGYSGPSIEIKRERGMGMVPQTPLPTVVNTRLNSRQEHRLVPSGEPVVVSVGLLATESDDSYPFGQREIHPSDQFTLDIFVFNQSSWTRRFEVSYPNADRRQRKMERIMSIPGPRGRSNLEELTASITPPGILPLQNRVRVGPLKPSTCQSVRMDFLAISPGVHSIDTLTLTDIETGYTVNLRSVMDIVVHEHTEVWEKAP